MPSTSKKQHNFMAAVAHNPAFAKKAGISQDVGKHFMSKDKGKKFAEGGSTTMTVEQMQKEAAARARKRAAEREAQAVQEAKDAKDRKATDAAYEQASRGMKKGGHVGKEMKAAGIFAKAGEKKLAAHERREAAGKEKDTPAIAKKEEAVLKKAKAPKDVQEYEKAEHKSMGMKKGGNVKKYAKQTKRGGSSARMAPPVTDPAAMMGGMGMGMAYGGSVHHHHYYGGGAIAGMAPAPKAKGKRADGIASKGKTRVKFR